MNLSMKTDSTRHFLLLFIAFFLIAIPGYSQNNEMLAKAMSLSKSSTKKCNDGNYAEAIRLETEASEIYKKELGKESEEYATALTNIATYYFQLRNYEDAIRFETEALEIIDKIKGEESHEYRDILSNLAQYNRFSKNYAEAIRIETQILEIYEKKYGKESLSYGLGLKTLAGYNSEMGNHSEAVRLSTEALEIIEKDSGKEGPYYADELLLLSIYNSKSGNYSEAIRLSTEALSLFEKTKGKNSQQYKSCLVILSGYYYSLGNIQESKRLKLQTLEIKKEKLSSASHGDLSDYYYSLIDLASGYSSLGDYQEAVNLGEKALQIYKKIYGVNNRGYAEELNDLAIYYIGLGNDAEAIRLLSNSVEVYKKLGEVTFASPSLSNMAGCYARMGNYEEAIRLQTQAMELSAKQDKVGGYYDYTSLAFYNYSLGNYSEVFRFCNQALEIIENTLGTAHPDYVKVMKDLAIYYFQDNQYKESAEYFVRALQILTSIVCNTFTDLTANERALFWDKYNNWFEDDLPKYAFYIQNDSLTATAYDGALLSKGLLLNSEIEMSKLLTESGDIAIVAKYEEQKSNRALFNKMIENRYADLLAITDTVARAKYKVQLDANIDSLERRLQMRERELVQESKAYGDYTKNLSIGWKQVQEKLGEKDVAIEFLNFEAENDSVMYVALTLTKEDEVPHLIPLFEKNELDNLSKSDYYNTQELSNLIWKPLSGVLAGKENIYFAPAGELHNIAIESIPCYDGDGLMSDKWNLYRLSSTRELALIKDKNEIKDAYLYGNLKYDTDVQSLVAEAGNYTGIDRSVDWETVNIADSLYLRGAANILHSLPATKEEVESIDKSLKSQNVNSTLLTEAIGTETSFKALTGQRPSVLHIATHGFYWSESEAKKFDIKSMAMLNDDSNNKKYVEDKALTRSGLFFAGAANAFRKDTKIPEGVDDGILTAKEISVLDLRGLDLVVLSACETGLGEITGDGVFGLQRGFKKAGAQTLMMSLWKVDDTATQMLMSQFYSNLAKGESKFEALKEAQQYVRTVDNGKYDDPRYWAAFILLDGE